MKTIPAVRTAANLLAAVLLSATPAIAAHAQASTVAPKKAPEGSTGLCKDGSYSTAASRKGACAGHKGVQTWYSETRASQQQRTSGGTNPPKATPSTTSAASSPEPIASPAPKP
ncbi:DUF3761 domain-containing protein [Terriglobus sp.]|uniref:DUF3761 domain-containing protein n=1 Tax=Terriglobus sp. TaxID=1889013 RepID=UPI003B0065A4